VSLDPGSLGADQLITSVPTKDQGSSLAKLLRSYKVADLHNLTPDPTSFPRASELNRNLRYWIRAQGRSS